MRLRLNIRPFFNLGQRNIRPDVVVRITAIGTVCDDVIVLFDVVSLHTREKLMRRSLTLHKNRTADFAATVECHRIEIISLHIIERHFLAGYIRFENQPTQRTSVFRLHLNLRHNPIEYLPDETSS